MIDIAKPKVSPGQVVATPAALQVFAAAGLSPVEFLIRHMRGDWGAVSPEDCALNDEALRDGSQILSAYAISGSQKIWIITEAADDRGDRKATTILLPEEY